MAFEWTEITYLEKISGNTGMLIFALSVMFVFLVLAALYESWALPLAVILVVPMCVLSSIVGVAMAKMDINIFTQIGFVVLVGLACKNAILIVEFAKFRREAGDSAREATLTACELRLRPILMTSLAFILGVVPLVTATGAGYEMRQALGTAVFSGMLGVTMFGIVLTPVFYFVIEGLAHWRLFADGPISRGAHWLLDLLRLGPVRRASGAGFRWLAEAAKRRPRPARKALVAEPARRNAAPGDAAAEREPVATITKTSKEISADTAVDTADSTPIGS
jgi:multidrug efflux pump